ncbi:flavodoxin domain-containing protein [Cryobacterium sp. 1639]|uniref:flavodoxin family protein n=1 Tax=Cryobacterium inferilacus TaxID=2866629 RepID=UPI001C734F39|nr:flavodoxin domain-containing protein [Cryobacterium sp. 1639]MBX0299572.1 flavodoxin domain-containing protein [Cryobacterium sp. 1639]
MRARVVYDTNYGNTRTIAEVIAAELGRDASTLNVADLTDASLQGVEVLVVGSPINGWRPTEKIQAFLRELPPGSLDGVRAAAFDTRVKLFIHGDAAAKISHALAAAGAHIVAKPQGFIVEGTEGPLAPGQTGKAGAWAAFIGAEIRAHA